jgi:hypothetical protein
MAKDGLALGEREQALRRAALDENVGFEPCDSAGRIEQIAIK